MILIQHILNAMLQTKNIHRQDTSACLVDLPKHQIDYQVYNYGLEGYCRNPVIYKCIRLIADNGSSLLLDSYKNNTLVPDNKSKAIRFFAQPNNYQDQQQFFDEVITRDRIYGNVFFLVTLDNNTVSSIQCLDNTGVQLAYTNNRELTYKYNDLVFIIDKVTGIAKYKSSLLLHLKTFNPQNAHTGLSPLEVCAMAGDLYNHGMVWNTSLLKNSAKPSGILKTDTVLRDEQFIRLKDQFKKFFQGSTNTGAVPILENGLEFQPMGLSPTDMNFLQTLEFTCETIAGVYNIPLSLVNQKSSTYNNQEQAKRSLYYDAVLPVMNRIINFLNTNLQQYFDNEKLQINLDNIHSLAPDRQKIFNNMIQAVNAGIISTDEARTELAF